MTHRMRLYSSAASAKPYVSLEAHIAAQIIRMC